jgi:hypothetical protein
VKRLISWYFKDDRYLRALARTDRMKAGQVTGAKAASPAAPYTLPTTTSVRHQEPFGL